MAFGTNNSLDTFHQTIKTALQSLDWREWARALIMQLVHNSNIRSIEQKLESADP